MNLDDEKQFASLDPGNMLAEIDSLPDQLQQAWKLSEAVSLDPWRGIQQVLITGMGGSAIGADLVSAYVQASCRVPLYVHRNYSLPAWAGGTQTLVIACSHSGNTEETLDAFNTAVKTGCRIVAISTGGKLAEEAHRCGVPYWRFEHHGQPRAAVGFSFCLLLGVLSRLGFVPDPALELAEAIDAMRTQQAKIQAHVPVAKNLAKRLAGQMVGRWVVVYGADILEPVARRWKGQLNELAKAWAQFDFVPEADHNTVAGVINPEENLSRMINLFLRAPSYNPNNLLRTDITRKVMMLEGLNTDTYDAQGKMPLAHQWTALHFGDYLSYYLAMAYQMDPTPIEAIQGFKREINAAREN